jgi:hypothetical protein
MYFDTISGLLLAVYFLVVNVFFGTVFAGSVFNKLNSFLEQPKSIPNALAAAIPQKVRLLSPFSTVRSPSLPFQNPD